MTGSEPQHALGTAGIQASGPGAVAVGRNSGVLQTGPGAQAQVFADAIKIREPSEVDAPAGGLVGLPRSAVRDFVGRVENMTDLQGLAAAGSGAVTLAVHGLGGVGKSELALQYATAYKDRYELVWWVNAETVGTLQTSLAELAFRLHASAQFVAAQEEATNWALGWLQSHDWWLLILDNVNDRQLVEPLLGLRRGHVIITTRRDIGWEDITNASLRLDILDGDSAAKLVVKISGQHDSGTARVLAAELGYLPLALRQAGAYLRQTRTSMDRYVRRLLAEPAALLNQVAAGDDAQRAVARTWKLTVTQIGEQNRLAVRVLEVMSCLAPDNLPRAVLYPLADADQVDLALGLLASYNMVTLTYDAIAVHRLVQAAAAIELQEPIAEPDEAESLHPPRAWDITCQQAAHLLVQAVPSGNPQTEISNWPQWAVLSPHVAALASATSDADQNIVLIRLFGQTGLYDGAQGRHQQALRHQERALAVSEVILGSNHLVTAACLSLDPPMNVGSAACRR